jgi:hypothetical protein
MKHDIADLKLVGLVIDEKGFNVLEGILRQKLYDSDNLSRGSGGTFEDGVLKGVVTGMKIYLNMIDDIRQEIKEMSKEDK